MKRDDIPVLQPVTGQINLEAIERIRRFLALDCKPWKELTEAERMELDKYENDLFELQMVNFRASVEAGDSEASRKAFFGSDYMALNDAYEREQEDERIHEKRCIRESRNDDPPAWSEK